MLRTFDPFREFPLATTPTVDYDIVRSDDGVELHIDIPGIDPAEVELTVDGRSLVLSAERPERIAEGATQVSRRRRSGSISRRFHLGESLDADRLEADYEFGVLTVRIPVAESAKPRRVAVGVGGAAAIEADSTEVS